MTKGYGCLLLIAAALSCLVAVFPLIPAPSRLLPQNPTPRETLDWLITFVGIFLTLTTVVFGTGITLSLSKSESDTAKVEALLREIRDKLGLTSVQLLQDFEFYPHFRRHTELAERSVDISYFELSPPREPSLETKLAYYREHFELVRRKRNVAFRRIFRDSAENREWIRQIVEQELANAGNLQVAIIKESGTKAMPLPLSVQVIDAAKVWFVAVATHGREREPRDIFIQNADLAMMMEKYFNRLWDRSIIIYNNGNLTEAGHEYFLGNEGKRDEHG